MRTSRETEARNQNVHKFVLEAEDSDILETVAEELEEVFLRVDGVLGMKKLADDSPSEMALKLDRDRVQSQGINPTVVATVVGYALRGQTLPRFRREGQGDPGRSAVQGGGSRLAGRAVRLFRPTDEGSFVKLSSISEPDLSRRLEADLPQQQANLSRDHSGAGRGQGRGDSHEPDGAGAGDRPPEGVIFASGARRRG